jgi:mRNA interferase MazF
MPINPQRGEIWRVDFDPIVGSEITKTRPAVVLDHGHPSLTLRIVAPITDWKQNYHKSIAKIHLHPTLANGLTKESAADAYQIKTVDLVRFSQRIGKLPQSHVDEVAAAVATIIDAP